MKKKYLAIISVVTVTATALFADERIWNGAGANAFASNPTNWAGETAPTTNDAIVLNADQHKSMIWNLDFPVASWTQIGYLGTVTVDTVYGATGLTELVIAGDCVISNGVWTQTANPTGTSEVKRLRVRIGGDLIVGSNATIDVTGKGYAAGYGTGKPLAGSGGGASHGGIGSLTDGTGYGPCYGSIVAPTNLGSGGAGSQITAGGGAILLAVAGEARLDGSVLAEGQYVLNSLASHRNSRIPSGFRIQFV